MPEVDASGSESLTCEGPEPRASEAPELWTPVQPPAPAASLACEPEPAGRSEWRGTAAQAVEESARRFEGTPTGYVRGDAAADRTTRAVPAESLVATIRSVDAQLGGAGPVYTVREDGSVHNTVTGRTEYVPVCLGPPQTPAPAAGAAGSAPPVAAPEPTPAPASAPAPEVAPPPPESHWWTRPLGAVKMVGGALETVAGGALVLSGVATSEVGVGVPVAIAGGAVAIHGLDTTASGARTLWYGEEVDTFTSQGLQAAGMSRGTANLVDAGIGVVGSLGAGAGTRALSATGEVGAVSVAFRPGWPVHPAPVGHNMVGVTTTEAGTKWSHLVISGERALVVGAKEGPDAAYAVVTVPVSAARADAALSVMQAQLTTRTVGAFSYLGPNCATHAGDVMRAGGILTFAPTPSATLASAALRSPGFVGTVSTSAAAVEAGTGVASLATGDEKDRETRAAAPE